VVFRRLMYLARLLTLRPRRYRHLLKSVHRSRARTIMEIGVFDGKHSKQMIETAAISWPRDEIEYWGFDLFELLSDSELDKEFSKRPPPRDVVERDLQSSGARITLLMGYTRDTLPRFVDEAGGSGSFDFVFIDGGHAVETIKFDWDCVRQLMGDDTVVIFDDYYGNTGPEVAGVGCRSIIENLDRSEFDVEVLSPEDRFSKEWGTLRVSMARVTRRQSA